MFLKKLTHNESKDALLNNICIKHSLNRIQSKVDKIKTYEINKILLLVLMVKCTSKTMDIMDQLLVIKVNYIKKSC